MGEGALTFGAGRLLVCKGLKFGESLAVGRAVGNTLGGNDVREGSHVDGMPLRLVSPGATHLTPGSLR